MSRAKKSRITFKVIPWNSSALNETLGQRAVASESLEGSFVFDVSFRSNHKGFVVQHIRKYISYTAETSPRLSALNVGEYGWKVDYEDCDDCNKECSRSCSQFLGENWEPANFDDCKNIPLPTEKKVYCKTFDYWEIFYIGCEGESWNTDRFAQKHLEHDSEGIVIQIGYAYFFPYSKCVSQQKDVVKLTKPIKKIFYT